MGYKALVIIIIFSPLLCWSQEQKVRLKHISIEQGLSNSTVEAMLQDSRGFIWFGTRDGLNRYDGTQIVVYRNDPKRPGTISNNYINCIYEDKNKVLWIGTMNGLNAFDLSKDQFISYKHEPGRSGSLSHNQVKSIIEDKEGRLWIGTQGGGLNLFDRGRFIWYTRSAAPGSLANDSISALCQDSKGNLWIGTEKGLSRWRPAAKAFDSYPLLPVCQVRNIAEDQQGKLWVGTKEQGLLAFDPVSEQVTTYQYEPRSRNSIATNQIRSIVVDRKGQVWVSGINGGINFFDASKNSFGNCRDSFGLTQRTISSLLEDRQGNLWMGTHRGGVFLYAPTISKFSLFLPTKEKNGLSVSNVKAFCEDRQGRILIGTDGGGLDIFDRKNRRFTHQRYNPYDPKSISSNEVLDVFQDSEHNVWISTWAGGLNLLRAGSHAFEHFRHTAGQAGSISSDYVQKVIEDRNSNLWVATYYGGLNLLDRKTKQCRRITAAPDGKTRLLGNNVVSLAGDPEGNIWIGTDDGGLNRYNTATGSFDHYFNNEANVPDIRVLFFDSKGRFWVGQRGLYLFDKAKNSFSLVTNGTEFIKGITEDAKGDLWISTSNGLTRFNPDLKTIRRYNTSDGLQGLEFEANAYLKTKDGEMYFGGVNGFNSFYPEQVRINTVVPPVVITDFQIFNQRVLPSEEGPLKKSITMADEIKLAHTQSTISFGFTALNFIASENNQYAYKLEGLEDSWNYVGTEHRASYNNLAPGTYTFKVKASNNDGVWNEAGASIKIVITPPFWGTWWFRALGLLAFAAAIITYYQYRRKLEITKIRAKEKEEMHQMQLQFFTNISHEFRTPLSLILGPLEKLKKENDRPGLNKYYNLMHRNVNRLLQLVTELMDFRKVESGALKLKVMPGNLPVFLHEIAEEFSEVALEKKIAFTVCAPHDEQVHWFDRQVLEKILINLLSNAFKYTPDGGQVNLEVLSSWDTFTPSFDNQLRLENKYEPASAVFIRVSDSGIGISAPSIGKLFERYYRTSEAHLGSGIGLAFVKSLTFLHKGSIYVSSTRDKGTEIIVGLPVGKADYGAEEQWLQHTEHTSRLQHKTPAADETDMVLKEQGGHGPRECILIVEDNPDLKTFLKESLSVFYQVVEAGNGMEGLQKAHEVLPDLVISDVMMPVMDGIEFCKRLKNDIYVSHIPFIMLTAKDALQARIEGTGSGADLYFSKPVSLELLTLSINNIFKQRKRLKERYKTDHQIEVRELVHTAKDKAFMDQLLMVIDSQLMNPDLDVEFLCTSMGMSRTSLYQKIKSITGQSINDFVRSIRLRKAADLMTREDVSISDVMVSVGIQTQSYFTKAFKKEFGKTPGQFLQELKK